MTAYACAITSVGLAAAAVVAVILAVSTGRRVAADIPAGPVATGWRYCPEEMRQRAAVLHADGTATCGDCHAHIPAGDQ